MKRLIPNASGIAAALLWAAIPLGAQTAGADPQTSVPVPAVARPAPADNAVKRPISLKLLLPNLLEDQRRIWSFPSRLNQPQDLIPTAAVLGATAGLMALDPTEAGFFRGNAAFREFNGVFTSNATMIGVIAAPVSLYVAGLARKDPKMTDTALLAGEAMADAALVSTVIKDVTRRVRPVNVQAHGNLSDSWFENGGVQNGGSFPSGHTIEAFAAATIVARRYRNHRWVPYVAYGAAALVGLSRLSLSEHFVSDVFVGGVLGYSISRFTVLRE